MYDGDMNTQSLARILTGSLIILAGIGALLDALGVFPFWAMARTWWPLAVILAGLLLLLKNRHQFIWALALIAGGALLQLRSLEVVSFNVWALFWPVVIIAIGLSVLMNRTMASKATRIQDTDDVSAIFGGSETINTSKNYQGGKATAVFGGVVIDLRDAHIKKEATLNVFALCGGVEVKVPREWKIQPQVFPIIGGVESKSHSQKADDNAPVLIITGTVALGGVEVRS
ncbi:hypothetical protein CL689_00755 [Candidatus Saccharibacteria bacterium]|nr:hypothetical protein [Candidatus Saccharibacteria bacterium]MBJ58610.1 hypothetical protein [Candidatus Saccharibacteria bacterium]MBQ68580.1 hypothetical protein [Candidatus Saccharibacteria bacterium]|tara:strand:+ start:571 stop:1257 length:687 start_codon:yes stop_codon:yes gene_type:complete